jgi:CRP-like cAMP-binding protein
MTTESPIELLRKHPFVRDLDERQVEQLGALAREGRFEPGRVLFREGEQSAHFYLIVSGMVALEISPPSGDFRVETLGTGDEFGWSSVMAHEMMFGARVLQDLHALVFDAAQLRDLCERDTAFGYRFMRRLLGVVADRLQVTRLLLMDSYWPVAKKAGA